MAPNVLSGYNRSSFTGYGSVSSSIEYDASSAPVNEEPRRPKRAYIKKATNASAGIVPPTSPPQLSDLAFNIHGWALEDGMTNRTTFEVINAYNATMIKGGFGAKIRELQAQVKGNVYRNDLTYTTRELDISLAKTDPAVSRYLVIGYTMREDDPVYENNKTFPRYSENELVGETRPAEHHVIRWQQCKTPILVVTPVKENTGTSIRLFGLVMPRSGLCQPVLLTHERIFYRWEYRASAGARSSQRNKNWNQVIIDKALALTRPSERYRNSLPTAPCFEMPEEDSVKLEEEDEMDYLDAEIIQHNEDDVFELSLDLETLFEAVAKARGIVNTTPSTSHSIMTVLQIELNDGQIGNLLHAIRRTRNDRICTQVEAHLKRLNKVNGVSPGDYPALVRFADAEYLDFDVSLAFDVADAIKILWPYLESMANVNALMQIKHVINRNHKTINEESLENVLRTTLFAIAYNGTITAEALQGRLKEILYSDEIIQNSKHYLGEASPGDMTLAIDTMFLVVLLKDTLAIHEWQTQMRAHLTRDMPVSYDSQTFAHIIDIDVSSLTLANVHGCLRWLLKHASAQGCDMEDVLIWLERLRLRIRQV